LYSFVENEPINWWDVYGLKIACEKETKNVAHWQAIVNQLEAKVKNIRDGQVKDRAEDLKLDKQGQKHTPHNPNAPFSQTRRGHWRLLNEYKALLAARQGELTAAEQQLKKARSALAACLLKERAIKKLEKKAEGKAVKCVIASPHLVAWEVGTDIGDTANMLYFDKPADPEDPLGKTVGDTFGEAAYEVYPWFFDFFAK
jgi:hypothetical protein